MVDCPQPHRVAMSCWVNPSATISEIMFDQFICEEYRNSDMSVKRHSGIIYRYNDYMEDIERTPFGRRLFIARIDAGFSQEDAAKSVGMKSQSTLSEAEISGKRSGFTSQLATLYKVNADWLATGKGNKELGATPAPALQVVRDPILDDLAVLPQLEAQIFRLQIQRAADIERDKQRAAQEQEVSRQQERDRRKHNDPPAVDRRRTQAQ